MPDANLDSLKYRRYWQSSHGALYEDLLQRYQPAYYRSLEDTGCLVTQLAEVERLVAIELQSIASALVMDKSAPLNKTVAEYSLECAALSIATRIVSGIAPAEMQDSEEQLAMERVTVWRNGLGVPYCWIDGDPDICSSFLCCVAPDAGTWLVEVRGADGRCQAVSREEEVPWPITVPASASVWRLPSELYTGQRVAAIIATLPKPRLRRQLWCDLDESLLPMWRVTPPPLVRPIRA